jgi:hypothetical protein
LTTKIVELKIVEIMRKFRIYSNRLKDILKVVGIVAVPFIIVYSISIIT